MFIFILKSFNQQSDGVWSSETTQIKENSSAIFPNITNMTPKKRPENNGTRRIWKEASLIENGTCANETGTLILIGTRIGKNFTLLYETCHDKNKALNLYTTHRLSGQALLSFDKSHKRPANFSQGNYFPGLNVHNLYSIVAQTDIISRTVGSILLANDYINSKSQLFFSRGHLSPDADFIDSDSQDATYYFLNTAPQWQTFNGGNWK